MNRLIRIEFRKIIAYPAFWVILGIHYFFLISFITNLNDFAGTANFNSSEYGNIDFDSIPLFQFPDIWQNIAYMAAFFKILLGIYMVINITNEFQYNTLRLNLSNGLTRLEFITSKFLLGLIISLFSLIILFGLGVFIGLAKNEASLSSGLFVRSDFLIGYFLEVLFYLTLALLIGTWLKRTGISIVVLLIYPLLIEPLVRWQIPDHIDRYFPVKAMDNLNVFPFPRYVGFDVQDHVPLDNLVLTVLWIGLMFLFSYMILKNRWL